MPTIISYRSPTDQTSHFLNVDNLLNSKKYEEIKKVYDNIYQSVTAYHLDHLEGLHQVENKLYKRIVLLEKEKKNYFKQKNKGWKAIKLSVLTLGIRPLIFLIKKNQMTEQIKEMHDAHARFTRSLKQMKQRGLEKVNHPKPKRLKDLEKRRLEDFNAELSRLKLTPRIKKSLEQVNKKMKLSISHQVAYGRSLELQEELKHTHYTINHGQNLELMLVNIIARKLKQEFEPDQFVSFEPLRHDTALRHIKEDTHTVAWYQNKLNSYRHNDLGLRKELICGDCVLESTTKYESAIDFFSGRTNIAQSQNSSFIDELLLTIIYDYIPNQNVAIRLCNDLKELFYRCPQGGNLYSICVPKNKFNESCYFSKPMGTPLPNQDELRGKIDTMQSGKDPCRYPQIRVLTHKVRAEDGYYVILNSTFKTQ